jgi:site-specific recombinase XerD
MLAPLSITFAERDGRNSDAPPHLVLTVLQGVTSPHTRRNYAKALDELFDLMRERCQPLSSFLFLEYKASLIGRGLSASTVNVRLSAVRKLISEARRHGILTTEETESLSEIPNVRQQGVRMGNWLTLTQARELLAVPDRVTMKGKRDYVILALLVGCALRRAELANVKIEDLQQREGRSVLPDLQGKGGRIRTVASLKPEKIITLADPMDLMEFLTAQRLRICQVVRRKRLSISQLAEELGRNRGSVTRDINKLKKLGLLRLRTQVNSGHGIVQVVEPAAQKFEVHINF